MADGSFNTSWALPHSGDVIQDSDPIVSFWRGTLNRIDFFNINTMESYDRDLEMTIIRDIASYGRQLGRVVEALQVVCKHVDRRKWNPDERRVVEEFSCMAKEIDIFKRTRRSAIDGMVDQFLGSLRYLKERDRESYERVLQRLRTELELGNAPEPTTTPEGTSVDCPGGIVHSQTSSISVAIG